MKRIILGLLIFFFIFSIPAFCPINGLLERAVTLTKWNYFDEAVMECDRLIQEGKEPWKSRAEFLKGHCLLKKGSLDQAREIFAKLSATPDFILNDYAKFYLAETYYSGRDWQRAYDSFKEIFRSSALWPESIIRRAECLEQMGDLNMATETYKALLGEASPDMPLDKARLGLGRCYEKNGSPTAAIRSYHEVNLYHPLSPLAKEAVAKIASLSKKYNIYPEAASAEDIFNKAMVFYDFGDFNSAGLYFQNIISEYRKSGLWEDAVFKAAMCDYKRKRLRSAVTRFKVLISRGGDYADDAKFYMAFAYGKSGYFYQALESLGKVVNDHPSSPFADDAYYYLGYYYEANGYKDTALTYYKNFVERYPRSDFAPEAYWRTGRLSYFNKDFTSAYDAFDNALKRCERGSMLEACAYWKGLVEEKLGKMDKAVESYYNVVSKFDHTYYSYRAREKLVAFGKDIARESAEEEYVGNGLPPAGEDTFGDIPFAEEALPFEPGVEEADGKKLPSGARAVETRDHFRKYAELMATGFYEEAAGEAALLVEYSESNKKMSARLALASADLAAGKVRESIIYAETICNNSVMSGTAGDLPRDTWRLAYPLGYYKYVSRYAAEFGLDENLVLAVIREESRFNTKTTSWANARGLMQIIPQTGRNVARLVGIRNYYTDKLHDPETNIKMGCYYLSQLMKRFNGNKVLVLAAYNGGPLRVQKWMNKWWNESGPNIDIDEFLESIPLSETRRYVQKVMKSYNEYKRLYTSKYPIITSKS